MAGGAAALGSAEGKGDGAMAATGTAVGAGASSAGCVDPERAAKIIHATPMPETKASGHAHAPTRGRDRWSAPAFAEATASGAREGGRSVESACVVASTSSKLAELRSTGSTRAGE